MGEPNDRYGHDCEHGDQQDAQTLLLLLRREGTRAYLQRAHAAGIAKNAIMPEPMMADTPSPACWSPA